MFSLLLDSEKNAEVVFSFLNTYSSDDFSFYKEDNSIVFQKYSVPFLSNVISDVIIELFESDLIKRLIEKNYCYFSNEDQFHIAAESINMVKDNSNSKKDLVYLSVYDYVSFESVMNLDGFIKFRLKDYIDVLEYLIDLAVNSFVINREYDRFIKLLREYISSSDSKIDFVHLVFLKNESILLDSDRNVIPFDNDILDAKYLSDISFSSNDFCLNTLLNILPKKIYVHSFNQKDVFLDTLVNIFDDRILFCDSCEICDFYRVHSSTFNT